VLDLARAQGRDDVGLVRDRAQHDLVDVRPALPEVVRVLLEDHLLLDLPVVEDERTGAERRLVEVAVLLDAGLADDEAPEAAERGQQARERFLGDEFHDVLAGRLDLVHRDEVGFAGRLLEQPIERELHVGGGQLLAVVELHALAQLEGPREPVGAGLPRLGQLGHRRHVGLEADELVVHHRRAAAAREGGHELRVEARGFRRLCGDQRAAGFRGLRERVAAHAERAEREAGGRQEVAAIEVP